MSQNELLSASQKRSITNLERYGVKNIFQSAEIKKKIQETNIRKFGAYNPSKCPKVREKAEKTNLKKYGVKNPLKLTSIVKKGMLEKYGVSSPLQSPTIREKVRNTNLQLYGNPYPAQNENIARKISVTHQNPQVRAKKIRSGMNSSLEETNFFQYILHIDKKAIRHCIHPQLKYVIDFYLPSFDIWIQFDGIYWHSKNGVKGTGPQAHSRKRIIEIDKIQNQYIPNLIRFWSDEFRTTEKKDILNNIMERIKEKKSIPNPESCHQYKKKIQHLQEDIKNLPFNYENISAKDLILSEEKLSDEIIQFIIKYEWLGTIGISPKWCFTARYNGYLAGTVLINEPTSYSRLLGKDTPKFEALIQRGASSSWAPKNTSSRLIKFSCRWMIQNTQKRLFVAYSDRTAGEKGIIYQSCGFDYIGDTFGATYLYSHKSIPHTFTSQYLKRTSTLKMWCRENNIPLQSTWFKENGFKNISEIPEEIKQNWISWGKNILKESIKIPLPPKLKYAIVMGLNKKEQKELESLKTYVPLPYIKKLYPIIPYNKPIKTSTGKTLSRINNPKINFIIDNYKKINRLQMAEQLKETPRWVKRQISLLIKAGRIYKNRRLPKKLEISWTPEILARIFELRQKKLKTLSEISETLSKEFSFYISSKSLFLWLKRFNCNYPSKIEWLQKYITPEIQNLKGQTIKNISSYILEKFEVKISEEIISKFLKSISHVKHTNHDMKI